MSTTELTIKSDHPNYPQIARLANPDLFNNEPIINTTQQTTVPIPKFIEPSTTAPFFENATMVRGDQQGFKTELLVNVDDGRIHLKTLSFNDENLNNGYNVSFPTLSDAEDFIRDEIIRLSKITNRKLVPKKTLLVSYYIKNDKGNNIVLYQYIIDKLNGMINVAV